MAQSKNNLTEVSAKIGHIYALKDPKSLEIRYVGQTILPLSRRLVCHMGAARRGVGLYCGHWISSLVDQGEKPLIESLQTVPQLDLDEAERWWIEHLKSKGANLTNLTIGGTGNGRRTNKTSPKVTCKRGHLYDEHGFINSSGNRECRICHRLTANKWQRAKRGSGLKRGAWTHCIRGHELAGRNLIITTTGARCCRFCKNQRLREYRSRKAKGVV
jgi:hypothetical protein